jgi:hypothetical protein
MENLTQARAIAAIKRRVWESEFGTPAILDAVEELLDLVPLEEVDRVLETKEAVEVAAFCNRWQEKHHGDGGDYSRGVPGETESAGGAEGAPWVQVSHLQERAIGGAADFRRGRQDSRRRCGV